MNNFEKLDEKELESVNGGMTVNYTLNHYCPDAGQYTFEAKNVFFDMNGNILVKKY